MSPSPPLSPPPYPRSPPPPPASELPAVTSQSPTPPISTVAQISIGVSAMAAVIIGICVLVFHCRTKASPHPWCLVHHPMDDAGSVHESTVEHGAKPPQVWDRTAVLCHFALKSAALPGVCATCVRTTLLHRTVSLQHQSKAVVFNPGSFPVKTESSRLVHVSRLTGA